MMPGLGAHASLHAGRGVAAEEMAWLGPRR